MRSNPELASSLAMAYPIPSEPPVTSAHPPLYLFLRSSLLLKKDPNTLHSKAIILKVPMKKRAQKMSCDEVRGVDYSINKRYNFGWEDEVEVGHCIYCTIEE